VTPDAMPLTGMTAPMAESPSLRAGNGGTAAYELKFLLDEAAARAVEAWARQRLLPDPHGRDGTYHTTSLYCDTSALDVYHRTKGFKRSKYRVRRYGETAAVHLERKTKRGDRVRKRRAVLPLEGLALLAGAEAEPDWPFAWFLRQVRFRGLRPAARIAYDRTALIGHAPEGAVRLTMDRHLVGVPTEGWELPPLRDGKPLLPGGVVVELKYQDALPGLFRELLERLPPVLARASKYRLAVQAWGREKG
jgi:hypothetical protein